MKASSKTPPTGAAPLALSFSKEQEEEEKEEEEDKPAAEKTAQVTTADEKGWC